MARINREQAAAASHPAGHAIVLAGPGTGKTSTLVARHSFLRSRGRDSLGIMVVTFTQKAAEELRTRLGAAAPKQAFVGTFHSICVRLLRRFRTEAGLRPNFRILDQQAQWRLLLDMGVRWAADDGDLTDIIGRWKDSLIDPAEAADQAASVGDGNAVMRMAAEHYRSYERELARRGDLDFADLIARAWKLVGESSTVGEFISSRITDVLVDEFQDVNRLQVEFLQALSRHGASIWAVADDDQALYGWRGGDVGLTVNFADRFPGARMYRLVENYRCDPAILAAANNLIAHNRTRVRKALRAARPHHPDNVVRVRGFRTEQEEATWIATDVARRMASGMRPGDICVLFRTASATPVIQQALEAARIPVALAGTANFWEMPEVTFLVDLLSEIEAGQPGPAAARSKAAREIVISMAGFRPPQAAAAAGRAVAESVPPGSASERAALWSDTAEAAAAMAKRMPSADAFRRYVAAMAARTVQEGGNAVTLSTIHSAKGLEWGHVYIAAAEAAMLPHHRSTDVEEERRLLYVALTRSKGAVDISHARSRFGRGQNPSPFLSEMMDAAVWVGLEDKPADLPAGRNRPTTPVGDGKGTGRLLANGIRVYRKRGGKSLIPPDEES